MAPGVSHQGGILHSECHTRPKARPYDSQVLLTAASFDCAARAGHAFVAGTLQSSVPLNFDRPQKERVIPLRSSEQGLCSDTSHRVVPDLGGFQSGAGFTRPSRHLYAARGKHRMYMGRSDSKRSTAESNKYHTHAAEGLALTAGVGEAPK